MIKIIAIAILSFISPVIAQPYNQNLAILIGTITNKTNQKLKIYDKLFNEITFINPHEKRQIDWKLSLNSSPRTDFAISDFSIFTPNASESLKFHVRLDLEVLKVHFEREFTKRGTKSVQYSKEQMLKNPNFKGSVSIDIVISENNLNNTKVNLSTEQYVPSLKEQSIEAVARKIKSGTLTLKDVKEKFLLPQDLWESLEEYL